MCEPCVCILKRRWSIKAIETMEGVEWVSSQDGEVPENAVEAGADGDSVLYVARANMFDDVLPGKLVAGDGCYVSYGGEEHKATEYEVLTIAEGVTFEWEASSGGTVPDEALAGGNTADGEPLYVGRGVCEEATICGKVHPSHGCLYVGHGGEEHAIQDYEVLVVKAAAEDD